MEQMYITRLEHVCSRLTKMGLTQMIVSDPLSIRYLTGVWVDPYERLYALYLRTDGKHRFFLNNLFVVPDIDIPKTWFSDTDDGVAVIAGLVDGNVEVNGTFETLVRLQRTQNAGAVAKQLFPEA